MKCFCDSTWVWTVHAAESSEIGKRRYSFLNNRNNMWNTLRWRRRPFQVRLLHVSSEKYPQQATKRHSRKKSTTEVFRLPNLIWILHILIFFRVINYSKEKKIEYFFLWDSIWYILQRHFSAIMWPRLKTKTSTMHNSKSIAIYNKIIYFYICSYTYIFIWFSNDCEDILQWVYNYKGVISLRRHLFIIVY